MIMEKNFTGKWTEKQILIRAEESLSDVLQTEQRQLPHTSSWEEVRTVETVYLLQMVREFVHRHLILQKLTDPSLIIYAPVRVLGNKTIVTNGDQTDTIYEGLDKQLTFEQSLRSREFEPDGPNYTPRISGVMHIENGNYSYAMSILRVITVIRILVWDIHMLTKKRFRERDVSFILINAMVIRYQALRVNQSWSISRMIWMHSQNFSGTVWMQITRFLCLYVILILQQEHIIQKS